MNEHTYKVIEIVGTSAECLEDAVSNAISRSSKSVRNMRWFEVVNTRGDIKDGRVYHWQVTLKVGFTLEE
jgi:flavin-binding protein dodecin